MAVHTASSLKPNEIPAHFHTGVFVLKWPEETKKFATPIATHLSIDPKGFYLLSTNKVTKETECIDLALIHDTRTGSQVSLPQNVEDCDQINIGALDVPRAFKWMTIYYGNTFVVSPDLRIIHFCFQSPNIAREWTEQLFRFGHNLLLRNLSSLGCLEKLHSRIIHSLADYDKKTIPVRNLIQFLGKSNRDTKEIIRHALEKLHLPSELDTVIPSDALTFEKFFRLYIILMRRRETEKLFSSACGEDRQCLTLENMIRFLKKQNDACDDYSQMDQDQYKARDIIDRYEQSKNGNCEEKGICYDSFLQYLLSLDNLIINPAKLNLWMDMDKPLAHYFISSSHNTYLTGNQWAGRASIEMYRQVLLTGCRCIELDVVDSEGKNDEPEIKHKSTPIRSIRFIEVIVAIREYAFKVTPYPLTLSIENYCSLKVQEKMAQYFIDVFGEHLITEPLRSHPCKENYPLPSPKDLKYKILIKNKKIDPQPSIPSSNTLKPSVISASSSGDHSTSDRSPMSYSPMSITRSNASDLSIPAVHGSLEAHYSSESLQRLAENHPRHAIFIEDEHSSDDDVRIQVINAVDNRDAIRETKLSKFMSAIVHYTVPVRFKTFLESEKRNRSFEMSSFSEDKAFNLVRDHAKDFLSYNQRQLSRIYPRGTRIESSNYQPYLFWPIGCQMVALNYQTLDIPMQLNLGLFSFNGACGYIEKPSPLCQPRSSFNPRLRTNVENVVGCEIEMKILSGQFFCQDREPSFVDVQLYGSYAETTKRQEDYRIRVKRWNGFQAIYDDTDVCSRDFSIRFPKIILPEMAALRFSVFSEDGTFVGQSFLPVAYLRSGYRHVVLRNQINIPVHSSTLFVYIRRDVYIATADQGFADRLVEPLVAQCSLVNPSEQNLSQQNSQFDDQFSAMSVRSHRSLTDPVETVYRRRTSSVSTAETIWFHKHLVSASRLHDRKKLTKLLSLNDIESKEVHELERTIQVKFQRVSNKYQKRIQKEQERLQKLLSLQQAEIQSERDRSWKTTVFLSRPRTSSTTNGKDIELCREELLRLYSKKFHQQEESECQVLTEYYSKFRKAIIDDFDRQISQINVILQEEILRVKKEVQLQIERDRMDIETNETDRYKVLTLKETSSQTNTKDGALTIQKLEDMHVQLKEMLRIHRRTNLNQLDEQEYRRKKDCIENYSNQLSKIQNQSSTQIPSNGIQATGDTSS